MDGLTQYAVFAADDIFTLSQGFLPETATSAQTSSARITAVLSAANYTGATSLTASPTATLGAYTIASGTNVNAYLNRIQEAEQGRIFMSRTGDLTSQPRVGNTISGSVADFHDDGTNIPYNSLGIIFNADVIVNRASIQHLGATSPQVADDAASQAKYLIQNVSITNSLLHNDAAALTLADYLLVGEPVATFNAVQTDYLMLTTAQREALALVDIGDTITITNTITGGQVAQELSVEGVEISVNINNGHRVTFYTASTVIVYEFILNDPIYGKLGIQDPQPVLA